MNLKLSLLALALLGAFASANALTITFQSTGAIGPDPATAGNLKVVDNTVVSSSFAPLGAFTVTNLTYSFVDAASTTGTGTLTLKRTSDNAIGTLALNFPGFTFLGATNGSMVSSAMTLGSGTGWLAGYVGGGAISGVYSYTRDARGAIDKGTSRSSFTAEVVPEPASLAALGAGVLALLRRRRR